MSEPTNETVSTRDLSLTLDRWLRFDPQVAARYEAEYGEQRNRHLQVALCVGLVLYNLYNVTSIVLLPDILWLSIALRVLLVTLSSLAIIWIIPHLSARWRELLMLGVMLHAIFIPVFLFWLTSAPLGTYTFSEFALTLVYGNMLLALRFPQAVVFTGGAFLFVLVAVLFKSEIGEALRFAFIVQIATACCLSLYASYMMERRRCHDYLVSLRARLDSEIAETARQQFENLSLTDALTGLPNRRVLDQRLQEWAAGDEPIVLMMIDVDHFKTFNDTLGHPAGDDCLRRIAATFQSIADRSDALCVRFGGEEFTIAIRHSSELEAARIANRLIKSVEELDISHPGRGDGILFVTVSVGIALRGERSRQSGADILAQADAALYQAKSRGRNQYAFGRNPVYGSVLCS